LHCENKVSGEKKVSVVNSIGCVNEFICNGVKAVAYVVSSGSGVCTAAEECMKVGGGTSERGHGG
jgi:hypothetical protein